MKAKDRKLNFIVTGAHGDIALSMSKILKEAFPNALVIGTDCDEVGIGKIKFEKFYQIPKVTSPDYVLTLEKLISSLDIDLVIPSSEPEIKFLNTSAGDSIRSKVLTLPKNITDLCFDKLATAEFLKASALPSLKTQSGNVPKPNAPFIIKPRFGAGSAGIKIILRDDEVVDISDVNMIFQEYVGTNDEEYTSCIYRDDLHTKTITLKRKLKYGVTVFAERVENPDIDKVLKTLASKLDLKGSINAQLRLVQEVPYIFEINPRFSSTVYYRHKLGFEDLKWSVSDKLSLDVNKETVLSNEKFYRFFDEVIV